MVRLTETSGLAKSSQSAGHLSNSNPSSQASTNDDELRKKTPVPVVLWKNADVMRWLKRCCADQHTMYARLFLEHDITGRSLVRMNECSLEKMGITNPDHKSELFREILKLKLKSDILEIKDLERAGADQSRPSSN